MLGWGLDYNVFAQSGISSEVIDEAVGGAPAALTFMDFHTLLASTHALELARVDGPRTFAEHAEVVCVDGRPTGELRENAAMDLVRDAMPVLSPEQRYDLCAQHLRRLAAVGLTGTHMMDGTLAWLDLLARLESRGDLVTRILAPFTIEPDTPEELWEVYAACGGAHGRRWRAGVAKFFIDGVIDSGTGWLVEPDAEGAGRDSFWPDVDRYRRAVAFFADRGFQCVTHATGDMGVRVRARHLRGGRRGRRRAAPNRAHRDAAAVGPAAASVARRRRVDAGAAHDVVVARPLRQLVAAARLRPLRPRVPDALAA